MRFGWFCVFCCIGWLRFPGRFRFRWCAGWHWLLLYCVFGVGSVGALSCALLVVWFVIWF